MAQKIPTTLYSPNSYLRPSTPTRVILVRHARTTYNEQGRYQGSSDRSVLTAKGHQDAYATGLALKEYSFDAIYTSPLKEYGKLLKRLLLLWERTMYHPCIAIAC